MLGPGEISIAIEDARARHQATVDLILYCDQKATTMLGLYITVGIASASAAVAAFSTSAIPAAAGYGLAAATVLLFAGALFCFQTIASAPIKLAGRDPDFWLWALADIADLSGIATKYLEQLVALNEQNRALNSSMDRALWRAMMSGIAAPIAALVVGLFVTR